MAPQPPPPRRAPEVPADSRDGVAGAREASAGSRPHPPRGGFLGSDPFVRRRRAPPWNFQWSPDRSGGLNRTPPVRPLWPSRGETAWIYPARARARVFPRAPGRDSLAGFISSPVPQVGTGKGPCGEAGGGGRGVWGGVHAWVPPSDSGVLFFPQAPSRSLGTAGSSPYASAPPLAGSGKPAVLGEAPFDVGASVGFFSKSRSGSAFRCVRARRAARRGGRQRPSRACPRPLPHRSPGVDQMARRAPPPPPARGV